MTKLSKEIQEGLYDPKKPLNRISKKLRAKLNKAIKETIVTRSYTPVRNALKGISDNEIVNAAEYVARKLVQGKVYDPKKPATKALSLPPSRWYEAMVKGIKKSSDVRNPYAIVKNIWAKLSPSKKAEIKAREKKGERFKYNLPLPVDKPTKGTGTVRMVKPFKLAEVQVNLSVKDYLTALQSGIFSKMKREDGTTALVARCKSPEKNVNIFVDKAGK